MGTGGQAARALRLLLFLVMAMAAVEYLFSSILDVSPLKSYLYTPINNATQPTIKTRDKSSDSWPKRLAANVTSGPTHHYHPVVQDSTKSDPVKNATLLSKVLLNVTHVELKTDAENVTKKSVTIASKITNVMEGMRNASAEADHSNMSSNELPLCDKAPPNLGPVPANKNEFSLEWVETKYPQVSVGGMYKPADCIARHKVAIIVPFRDRLQHLAVFLHHMHPFLMKQKLDYGIFVVEQLGNSAFNRAKLFNVGFAESQKARPGGWQCFVFHDVDLLPIDERNMYSCPKQPRHMSAAIDKHNYKLPYYDIFGGVSALTLEQFTKVNGFSNKYWGWGGEDDDISYRVRTSGYHIARYKMSIARYTMLDHQKASPNPKRFSLLSQTYKDYKNDGLSTLKYDVVQIEKHHLYTLIKANVDERS